MEDVLIHWLTYSEHIMRPRVGGGSYLKKLPARLKSESVVILDTILA